MFILIIPWNMRKKTKTREGRYLMDKTLPYFIRSSTEHSKALAMALSVDILTSFTSFCLILTMVAMGISANLDNLSTVRFFIFRRSSIFLTIKSICSMQIFYLIYIFYSNYTMGCII
jgi:uncharacterized membrane protein YadS